MKKTLIILLNIILLVESSSASNNSSEGPLNILQFLLLLLFGLPMAITFVGYLIFKSFQKTKKRLSQTPEQKSAKYLEKELKKMQDDYMKR